MSRSDHSSDPRQGGRASPQSAVPSVPPNPQPPGTNTSPHSSHSDSEQDDFECAAEDFEARHAHADEHSDLEEDDDDDEDDEEPAESSVLYWCHPCQEEITPLFEFESGMPICPHCRSEFLEQIDEENDPRQFIHSDDDDHEHEHEHDHDIAPADFVFFDHPHDAHGTGGGAVLHGGAFGVQLDGSGVGVAGGPPADVARLLQGWLHQVLGNAANGAPPAPGSRPSTIHTPAGEEGHAPAAEVLGETAGAHAAAAEALDDDDPGRRRPAAAAPTGAAAGPTLMAGAFPGAGPGLSQGFTVHRTTGLDGTAPQMLDLTNVLQSLLGMGDPGQEGPNPLHMFFNMVGNPGDYVFGQRGLDDIITQLMEQTGQRNAPPPASEDLISSLPEVKITKADMAAHADCSVCQDEYTEGETVTALPCKHLFHGACIEHWLKVNGNKQADRLVLRILRSFSNTLARLGPIGTCPVCRHSLVSDSKEGTSEPPVSSSRPVPPTQDATASSSTDDDNLPVRSG
ncbi:hypothetical protein HDU87_000574 [Geranomyces variabilis]|uniref:RING-type E3 ubiquitin transferase n=1 Tax=Geranomyces variabilis TaxID=109894 RepID=A0AAD5TC83_9FUNG|nr:hypothetical protein HDU87_000574 [Geranomyces variabilis]